MKIDIATENKSIKEKIKKKLLKHNVIFSDDNPDVILSVGGDGMFLIAEKKYPGIPKLLIKDSKKCAKCSVEIDHNIIALLKEKKYKIKNYQKITAKTKGISLTAANDFIIRNKKQQQAIRFEILIDGKKLREEMFIGDGIVVATPWGSTGYFHSIAKKSFEEGIGLALNNVNDNKRDIILNENSLIELRIIRGNAVLTSDNDKKEIILKDGDKVEIKKSKKIFRIINF